jgi:hypothetical protein
MWSVQNPDAPRDDELRALLRTTRRIAVLGIKSGAREDAFEVPRYLQARGYRILPVNPKLERVLGETAQPRLAAIDQPVDIIDVFRAARHLPDHVDEILSLDRLPLAVWLQLGIRHDACAERLRAAGVGVVQDRCLLVEHRRLFPGSP